MKAFLDTPEEFSSLNIQLKEKVSGLLSALKIEKRSQRIRANTDLASDVQFEDYLVVLSEGGLTYCRSGKKIFSYEPGDLVGVERLFRPSKEVVINSELPVTVDIYSSEQFFSYLIENPNLLDTWSEILVLKLEIYASLISSLAIIKLREVKPKEILVPAGKEIIKEGDVGTEVFCILEGCADVSIAGTDVGEIREDEVFGVLAALGGVPRIATVTTRSECRILVVDKTDFSELIKAKPEAFEKVMQDTARAIKDLNAKVSGLGPQKPEFF